MIDMTNNKFQLNMPDTTLPFFAYGTFKPGQIAYSRIEPYVKGNPIKEKICNKLFLRDGLPFITLESTERPETIGYLIEFNNYEAMEAYDIICTVQSKKLYYWKEISVAGRPANVLIGKKPRRSRPKRLENSFHGEDDPYFNEVFRLINDEINDMESIENFNDYFEVLRNYIFLWAAIERYASLRFGNLHNKNKLLAQEDAFQNALRKVVGDKRRKIYRTDNLFPLCLDANDPEESIDYYYTVRCNIVHRGKLIDDEDKIVFDSLKELSEIFDHILKETFKK